MVEINLTCGECGGVMSGAISRLNGNLEIDPCDNCGVVVKQAQRFLELEAEKTTEPTEFAESIKKKLFDIALLAIEFQNDTEKQAQRIKELETELATYKSGNIPVTRIIADNEAMSLEIEQLRTELATYKNTVTEFEAGNKPDVEFKCEAAVWMKNGNGSICYTGSLERAEFIANRLNAYGILQSELAETRAEIERLKQ